MCYQADFRNINGITRLIARYIDMKDLVKKSVLEFLKNNIDDRRSLLLGLSGGIDSLALFYILLECQMVFPFKFSVAHVDHGWRPESSKEASSLKDLAKKHCLPFHLKVLKKEPHSNNLEARCRELRISFFNELNISYDYQAVILGHHFDDQAETVLKNVFEGAHLSSCNGIEEVTRINQLEMWRPLLKIPKAVLSQWLEKKGYVPFIDETNFDTKYLRARMRSEIIPYLEETFGKGIKQSLASLGRESQELREFFLNHLSAPLDNVKTSGWGSYIDLSEYRNLSLFEMKFLVRQVCRIEHCFPSKEIVENASVQLMESGADKQFDMGEDIIYVDRMRLFVVKNSIQFSSLPRIEISENSFYGSWEVKIEDDNGKKAPETTDWKDIWLGRGEVVLPKSQTSYQLGMPIMNSCYPRSSSLSKWWNKHKIPAFLRRLTPVIWCGESIVYEFLTGKNMNFFQNNDSWQKINLIRRD